MAQVQGARLKSQDSSIRTGSGWVVQEQNCKSVGRGMLENVATIRDNFDFWELWESGLFRQDFVGVQNVGGVSRTRAQLQPLSCYAQTLA